MERSWAGLQNTKKWAWKTAIGNEVRGVGRSEIVWGFTGKGKSFFSN